MHDAEDQREKLVFTSTHSVATAREMASTNKQHTLSHWHSVRTVHYTARGGADRATRLSAREALKLFSTSHDLECTREDLLSFVGDPAHWCMRVQGRRRPCLPVPLRARARTH